MIILLFAVISFIICSVFYYLGYKSAMKTAEDMLDSAFEEKFKDAGIVVKKDDRIIECNGMIIPLQCEKCRFGVVKEDEMACFAPDYDLIPVIGLRK